MALTRARAPGPRGLPMSGNLWSISQDALGFLLRAEARYGAVVRTRLGAETFHLISDPALAEQILWRQSERFTRDSPSSRMLRDITGTSLLNTVGPAWLARRKLIAPYFTRAHLLTQVPLMTSLAERHLARWAAPDASIAIDASAAVMEVTCAIASQVLFGVAVEDPALARAMEGILAHHWRRLRDPLQLAHRLPTRSHRAFVAGNRVVADIVAGLGEASGTGTLLGALRTAGATSASAVAGLTVEDELITLLIAGHETTANALGWALHLLAEHPQEQQRLRAEACAASPQALAQVALPCAVRIFQEGMRLYPPIWLIERQALQATEVGGFTIAAGGRLIISPWVIHRSQRFWDRPHEFLPERFRRAPAKHTFLPFGLGPHACVGANLAMIEGPLLLALIARRWRWRGQPRTTVAPRPGLTLRMQRPLRLLMEAA